MDDFEKNGNFENNGNFEKNGNFENNSYFEYNGSFSNVGRNDSADDPAVPADEPWRSSVPEDNNVYSSAVPENDVREDTEARPAENGYSFHADGTYSYSRPAAQQPVGGDPADGAGYGGRYDGGPINGNQGPVTPPPARPVGPGGPGVSGGASPYPYANSRAGYAYAQEENGGRKETGVKKKGKGGKIFAIVTGVLCLLLIVALVYVIATGKNPGKTSEDGTAAAASDEQATKNESVGELVTAESPEEVGKTSGKDELSAKQIYQKVLGSSVGILVYNKSDSLASEGSGVLFQEDSNGEYTYIITCAHVIAGSNGTIMVQMHDEKQYQAEVVGYDNRTDIGVLRIKANGLQLAEIGDSSKLAVGDTVYAIGNPGGVEFANSFTNGMVSALDRPVNSSSSGYTMECIQHTTAINPGNSGGALVNVFGQVIGINSMKIVDDEYEGMGFSVPSSVFVDIVNNIIVNGYVANRPKLGITYVAAQNYNSYGMFVAIKDLPKGSIVIYSIAKDSGLVGTDAQEGDMIIAVNGKDLDDASSLSELIEQSKVGDEITLTLVRINRDYSFEQFDVRVNLVEDRGDGVIEEETTASRGGYDDYYRDYFGDYFDDYFGDFFR